MTFRLYSPSQDRPAVAQIWKDIGWLREGREEMLDVFLESSRVWVATLNGRPESIAFTAPATMRYLQAALPMCAVTAVGASLVARKRGLTTTLTARAIAADVAEGAIVAGLGMFEQGFYDRLGFGAGPYEIIVRFDPSQLAINASPRVPCRLELADWEAIHRSRLSRQMSHGACCVLPAGHTRGEMMECRNGFGLGYRDETGGELSHHFWCDRLEAEHGPYRIKWMAYQNGAQLLELMGLLRNLGDQIHCVTMLEPPHVQLQDLLREPFTHSRITRQSPFESNAFARAFWQRRICNVPACLERTQLRNGEVRFNAVLHDPIERYLDDSTPWKGAGGEYIVTLGRSSGAEKGHDTHLPTLTASVNAFTRLWLGVLPASGLAVTDDLNGPPALLEALDWILCLPSPRQDWEF